MHLRRLFLLLPMISMVGCAYPKANLREDISNMNHYRSIFIIPPTPDPQHIAPMVQEAFTSQGYPATLLDEKSEYSGSQGTAFLISSQGHLLTCAHVLGKSKAGTVWFKDKEYVAHVIKEDEKLDVALLQIENAPAADLHPLLFTPSTEFAMGQKVFTIGYPMSRILGSKPRLNQGLISAAYGMKDDVDQLQISAEIQPGNSGSPLMNERGEIIGMVQKTMSPMSVLNATNGNALPQNVNFALKSTKIQNFLKDAALPTAVAKSVVQAQPFDVIQQSILKFQAGRLPPQDERKDILIVDLSYVSWLMGWPRFSFFKMWFYDYLSADELFTVGQYEFEPFSTQGFVVKKCVEEAIFKFRDQKIGVKPTKHDVPSTSTGPKV